MNERKFKRNPRLAQIMQKLSTKTILNQSAFNENQNNNHPKIIKILNN